MREKSDEQKSRSKYQTFLSTNNTSIRVNASLADSLIRMGEQSLQALHHHEDSNKSKQTLKHDRK